MEGVRPSSRAAPSIWNDAVAVPHEKPTGNVNVEGEVVVLDAVTGPVLGHSAANLQIGLAATRSRPRWASPATPASASSTPRSTCSAHAGSRRCRSTRSRGGRRPQADRAVLVPVEGRLVDAVLGGGRELVVVIDAAVRAAPDDPLDRIDAVVRAVFRRRSADRRCSACPRGRPPAPPQAERLRELSQPLVDRAVDYLGAEMDAGRLRRGDPRLIAALATPRSPASPPNPRPCAVGWSADAAGLRRLRAELPPSSTPPCAR